MILSFRLLYNAPCVMCLPTLLMTMVGFGSSRSTAFPSSGDERDFVPVSECIKRKICLRNSSNFIRKSSFFLLNGHLFKKKKTEYRIVLLTFVFHHIDFY